MKNVVLSLIAAVMILGSPALAASQSQTLIRFASKDGNGLILTLPASAVAEYQMYKAGQKEPVKVQNAALLFEKRNPLPALLAIGANYALFNGGLLATVSEDGTLYYKGKIPYTVGTVGGNYFLDKVTNELIVIDSAGYFVSTGITAFNVRLLGGNFFVDQSGLLTTIKHMGAAPGSSLGLVTQKEGWDFNDAIKAGGNFLVKIDGSIVGINSENGFFTEPQKIDSPVKYIGGNYFITEDKTLYTVNNQGIVLKKLPIVGQMKYYGYSYMIDGDGDFIFVDSSGFAHTQLIRISTTGIKAEAINKISDKMDVHMNFIKAEQ